MENWIFLEKENNFKRLLYKLKLRRVDSKNALEKQAQSSDVVKVGEFLLSAEKLLPSFLMCSSLFVSSKKYYSKMSPSRTLSNCGKETGSFVAHHVHELHSRSSKNVK